MSGIVVLMYHALYDGSAEREAIAEADRPYALPVATFRAQLDHLRALGLPILDPAALAPAVPPRGVLLTFDDGHASNYRHAFAVLRERGHSAVFFVTTDFIDRRPGFCTWAQLREMSEAGQHIGSHGRTHRFFEDLDEAPARAEFADSKAAIAGGCGTMPSMLSFPGGRFHPSQLALGRAAGFRWFFSSEVGRNRPERFASGQPIRRVAIREATSAHAFGQLASGRGVAFWRAATAGRAKRGAQRLLGNRLYHSLYERLARG